MLPRALLFNPRTTDLCDPRSTKTPDRERVADDSFSHNHTLLHSCSDTAAE